MCGAKYDHLKEKLNLNWKKDQNPWKTNTIPSPTAALRKQDGKLLLVPDHTIFTKQRGDQMDVQLLLNTRGSKT